MWDVKAATHPPHTIRAASCVLIKLKKLRLQQNMETRVRMCACKHARRSGTAAHLSTVQFSLSDSAADTCRGGNGLLKSIQL